MSLWKRPSLSPRLNSQLKLSQQQRSSPPRRTRQQPKSHPQITPNQITTLGPTTTEMEMEMVMETRVKVQVMEAKSLPLSESAICQ